MKKIITKKTIVDQWIETEAFETIDGEFCFLMKKWQ